MSLAPQPVGAGRASSRSSRSLYILWSIVPGRDRDPVRVQRRPLAHDLAGLLDALVHRRPDRQRAARPGAAGRAQAHALPRRSSACSSRRRSASRSRSACSAGAGRGGGTVNTLMLLPLVTPEIVMGVALLLLFLQVFPAIGLGHDGAGDRPGDVHALVRRRDRARPARLDRAGVRGGGRRPRRAAARPAAARAAAAARARRSSRARRSCSRSRSTTSSSRSTSPATRARRRSRCCSTRRPAARRLRR